MKVRAAIIGKILMDLIPEAENSFEAIDIYLSMLYKLIQLKKTAEIDDKEDFEMFLYLSAYKTPIAESVHRDYLGKKRTDGGVYD